MMVIIFGGTFFFISIMFMWLGIGEAVWPILFPILAGTFGVIVFVFIIVGAALRVGGRVPSDQMMVRMSYTQPTYPTYDSPSTGSVYVIPVYCPQCLSKLELDRVEWIGPEDLTCPNCLSAVQAGLRENF